MENSSDSDAPAVDASEAAQAAAEAAAQTTEAITEVHADAQAAIEAANERTEIASRTAEQIAEAALETERGHSVGQLREDLQTWRTESEQRLASQAEQITALQLRLTESQPQPLPAPQVPPAVVAEIPIIEPIVEALQPSIPPVSGPGVVTEAVVQASPVMPQQTEANLASGAVLEVAAAVVPRRRSRWT